MSDDLKAGYVLTGCKKYVSLVPVRGDLYELFVDTVLIKQITAPYPPLVTAWNVLKTEELLDEEDIIKAKLGENWTPTTHDVGPQEE